MSNCTLCNNEPCVCQEHIHAKCQKEITNLRSRLADAQAQSEQYRLETHRWADAAKKDREERDGLWKKIADAQARAERADGLLKEWVRLCRETECEHDDVQPRLRATESFLALTPATQGRTDGERLVCHTCLMPPTECKCIPLPTAEIDLKTGALISDATAPEVKGGAA